MIYDFSHYPTSAGRRVRFTVAREHIERVREAGFTGIVDTIESMAMKSVASPGDVMFIMTPRRARMLVDALASVGGDAAVAARMLTTALDGMVDELRIGRLLAPPRRRSKSRL